MRTKWQEVKQLKQMSRRRSKKKGTDLIDGDGVNECQRNWAEDGLSIGARARVVSYLAKVEVRRARGKWMTVLQSAAS